MGSFPPPRAVLAAGSVILILSAVRSSIATDVHTATPQHYTTTLSFAGSEITMQAVGYQLGIGAGKLLGEIGSYAGFVLLAESACF